MRGWVLVLVLMVAGCGGPGEQPRGVDREFNRAEMQRVVEQLRADDRVLDADGTWSGSLTTTGNTSVSVTVADGTPEAEQESVLDRAEELVWRSEVDPVLFLSLRVTTSSAPADAPGLQRSYDRAERFAELERSYGPRPVTD